MSCEHCHGDGRCAVVKDGVCGITGFNMSEKMKESGYMSLSDSFYFVSSADGTNTVFRAIKDENEYRVYKTSNEPRQFCGTWEPHLVKDLLETKKWKQVEHSDVNTQQHKEKEGKENMGVIFKKEFQFYHKDTKQLVYTAKLEGRNYTVSWDDEQYGKNKRRYDLGQVRDLLMRGIWIIVDEKVEPEKKVTELDEFLYELGYKIDGIDERIIELDKNIIVLEGDKQSLTEEKQELERQFELLVQAQNILNGNKSEIMDKEIFYVNFHPSKGYSAGDHYHENIDYPYIEVYELRENAVAKREQGEQTVKVYVSEQGKIVIKE